MIRIHNFPRGARGLRLFWQCEEMDLPYEAVTVTFPPSAEYLALNPMGSVPFLEDEGVAINESVAIMLWLARRHGPTPLLPADDDPALATVMQMLVFSEATLGANLNVLMAAKFGAPAEHRDNWSAGAARSVADRAMAFVEAKLGDRPFLAGDRLTLADIAVCTSFGMWVGALNLPLGPRLEAWRDSLRERPAYQRAMAAQS